MSPSRGDSAGQAAGSTVAGVAQQAIFEKLSGPMYSTRSLLLTEVYQSPGTARVTLHQGVVNPLHALGRRSPSCKSPWLNG